MMMKCEARGADCVAKGEVTVTRVGAAMEPNGAAAKTNPIQKRDNGCALQC